MNRSLQARWLRVNLAVLTVLLPIFMIGFQNCSPKNFDVAADDANKATNCDKTVDPNCDAVPLCPADNPDCDPTTPPPLCTNCAFELVDQIVQTDPGVPKEFTAVYTGDRKNYQLSFQTSSVVTLLTIPSVGTVEVINQGTWTLRFTPLASFTGSTDISLHAIEGGSKLIDSARVTLSAGINTVIPIIQPALAVRASACVMCHADVKSNIITDLGYNGDSKGRDYYFGKNIPNNVDANKMHDGAVFNNANYGSGIAFDYKWNDGSIYGDDKAFNVLGNWAQLKLESGKKVLIPKGAGVPSAPAAMSGATTLKDYLLQRFSLSPYPSTTTAQIAEYSNVFIGAPTAARLRTVFGLDAASTTLGVTYVKSAADSAALAGLSTVGASIRNTGNLVCEGDVLVNGPLLLKNLTVDSRTGCRIYATGSVFVYGTISYVGISAANAVTNTAYAKNSLQISSSKAILMGLGEVYSGAAPVNGVATSCEASVTRPSTVPSFFYLSNSALAKRDEFRANNFPNSAELAHYDKQNWDSMYSRMTFWMNGTHTFRDDTRDGFAIGKSILAEYAAVGTQKDAACEAERRSVAFNRLLLNAPQVHSRYWGDFSGVIIAEFILPALGQFHFKYDPVFLQVPILPRLQAADYLKVQ